MVCFAKSQKNLGSTPCMLWKNDVLVANWRKISKNRKKLLYNSNHLAWSCSFSTLFKCFFYVILSWIFRSNLPFWQKYFQDNISCIFYTHSNILMKSGYFYSILKQSGRRIKYDFFSGPKSSRYKTFEIFKNKGWLKSYDNSQ